jgi:hypothetical protein
MTKYICLAVYTLGQKVQRVKVSILFTYAELNDVIENIGKTCVGLSTYEL